MVGYHIDYLKHVIIKLNSIKCIPFYFHLVRFFFLSFNFGLWTTFLSHQKKSINNGVLISVNYIPLHSISFLPFHLSLYIHRIKEQNLIRNYMQSAHVLFSFNPRRWLACVIPPGYARWDRIVLQGWQDGKQIWSVRYGPF